MTLVRKWRQKSNIGLKTAATSDQWVFEVGHSYEIRPMADSTLGMIENNTTVRVDTRSGRPRVNHRVVSLADLLSKRHCG